MCARYTLTQEQNKIMAAYQVKLPDDYRANYNIAPTQNSLVITSD
ncbi:putative SOS response-associated peptidase YedK [Pedobacter cryoconitis]|uniref:Putative SOS response-associated peptidase YedK n=1 Tax=Pedobacter cryoconitis TaxID=188932 RepID=A0A7W8ZI44_9SPHI|nr:putative SOS response-associated peptidase YedK [Pedobacter cryoconitis]